MADGGSRHTNEQREASKSQESVTRKSGQRAGNFLESSCKQTQFSSHTYYKHTYLQSARIREIGTQDTQFFLHFLPLVLFFFLFFIVCLVTTYFSSFDVLPRDIAFQWKIASAQCRLFDRPIDNTNGKTTTHYCKYFEHIWWNHFPLRLLVFRRRYLYLRILFLASFRRH